MRKLLLTACSIGVCTALFSGCGLSAKNTVKSLNENSNFAVPLLMKEEEVDFSNFGVLPGFGIKGYYDKKYGDFAEDPDLFATPMVIYSVSGWPDTTGDRCVTQIEWSDPEIHAYGITAGTLLNEADEILKDRGFSQSYDSGHMRKYDKGDVQFRFSYDNMENVLTMCCVYVDSSNIFGIIY